MLDYFLITLGGISTLLGFAILLSNKCFLFWRDKITKETNLSKEANFANRWVRGGLYLFGGIAILIILLF